MPKLPVLRTLVLTTASAFLGGLTFVWVAERSAKVSASSTEANGSGAMVNAETWAGIKGWTKGKGWGWIWGQDDEVGALNAQTAESRAEALKLAARGEVFDLGMTY